MDWGLLLAPAAYPQYVAVALMWLLAAVLVRLDVHNRPMRAFALFLVIRGGNMLLSMFGAVTLSDPPLARIWWRLSPFFLIAAPFAILYFVSLYPKPRGPLAKQPWGPVAVVLGCGIFEYAFLFRPELLASLGVDAAGTLNVLSYGPFILFLGLLFLGYGVASVLIALEYIEMEDSALRPSLLLVSLAFALNVLYDATGELFRTSPNAAAFAGDWISLSSLLIQFSWIPVVGAVILLIRHALASDDDRVRGHVLRYVAVLPLPVISNAALSIFVTGPAWENPAALLLNGFWRLSLPVLIVYALLRHRLFDLDVKVKWAIKQSTVAVAFTVVFFLASEGAELLVEEQLGPLVGLAAAGVLTLAFSPLQRMGEDLADKAIPGATTPDDLVGAERVEFYREQVEIVLTDDRVTAKERKLLDNLADRLDLPDDHVQTIERETGLAEMGVVAG